MSGSVILNVRQSSGARPRRSHVAAIHLLVWRVGGSLVDYQTEAAGVESRQSGHANETYRSKQASKPGLITPVAHVTNHLSVYVNQQIACYPVNSSLMWQKYATETQKRKCGFTWEGILTRFRSLAFPWNSLNILCLRMIGRYSGPLFTQLRMSMPVSHYLKSKQLNHQSP